jgi:hypothetical protein
LHNFNGTDVGLIQTFPGLEQATNGTFLDQLLFGGTKGDGKVYALSFDLGPFVRTLPTSGKVGDTMQILVISLTGATSVTFNGMAAAFTVVSATQITATVPAGRLRAR